MGIMTDHTVCFAQWNVIRNHQQMVVTCFLSFFYKKIISCYCLSIDVSANALRHVTNRGCSFCLVSVTGDQKRRVTYVMRNRLFSFQTVWCESILFDIPYGDSLQSVEKTSISHMFTLMNTRYIVGVDQT